MSTSSSTLVPVEGGGNEKRQDAETALPPDQSASPPSTASSSIAVASPTSSSSCQTRPGPSSSSSCSHACCHAAETSNSRRSSGSLQTLADAKGDGGAKLTSRTQLFQMLREIKLGNRNKGVPVQGTHPFWDTQPVPQISDVISAEDMGAIEPPRSLADVRAAPYKLPEGFAWDDLDVTDEPQRKELYTLLNEHYVEDEDNLFRFDYSPEFLQWALTSPGYLRKWHAAVRVEKTNKLVGFISGIPVHLFVHGQDIHVAEINFLCVHKKLRAKRLAPVLIREITRRVNLEGVWQAVYTAGILLPKPIGACRYWHRSLNPRKLIDVGFSGLGRNMTVSRAVKLFRLPENTKTPGLRLMTKHDVKGVSKLLQEYLASFRLHMNFSEAEVEHWFVPRPKVVYTYVTEVDGEVRDLVSFYFLASTIIGNTKHKTLSAAYSFYNVARTVPLVALMRDALVLARNLELDVFNSLDLMENKTFFEELKFGVGDGHLQYYLFNWRCPSLTEKEVGLVLL
eukprot:GHVT01074118.1.p1 GENE.GHVT01074118.1~~GHVT01074118.1.p1  ORF type:complete len:510 (-),score=122.80 GHVT01074118.1:357-1886(-)